MGDFHELGLTGVHKITESHHFDKFYDKVTGNNTTNKDDRSDSSESSYRSNEKRRRNRDRRPDSAVASRRDRNMTYSDDYAQRPRSQHGRGGGGGYSDDGDSGSDYDEQAGERRRGNGRGYGRSDDLVRETYETERYRGVSTAPHVCLMRLYVPWFPPADEPTSPRVPLMIGTAHRATLELLLRQQHTVHPEVLSVV